MRTYSDKKNLSFLIDIIVALILITFVVCASFIGLNLFKPQIESAVSQALGMTVTINGTIELDILPRPALTVTQLRIHGQEADPLLVEHMTIAVRLRPLLRGKIHVQEFTLVKPRVYLLTDVTGGVNFAPPAIEGKQREAPPVTPAVPVIDRFAVTGGELVYADARTGRTLKLDGLDMDLYTIAASVPAGIAAYKGSFAANMVFRSRAGSDDIVLKGLKITLHDIVVALASVSGTGAGPLAAKDISFATDVSMASLRAADISVSPLIFTAKAQNGMFVVQSLSFGVFGGKGSGRASVNLRGTAPDVSLQAVLSGFRTEEFIAALRQKKTTEGRMDLSLDLSTRGSDRASMVRGLTGTFTLSGRNLTLHMIDLDALLKEIRKSQTFSMVDIGAYFFAGPLGTALTQGYDFAGVYRKAGSGTTSINNVISRWKLEHGLAEAADVAIATAQNRLAVNGTLDLLHQEYKQVTVAILDGKGCAILSQPINGPFGKPRLGTVSMLKTLVGPALGVLSKTKSVILLEQCKPFYAGSLPHPDGSNQNRGDAPRVTGSTAE